MLHLEKKKSSREIHVTVRKQRNFWNPILAQAFLCALFLHIFPFTVFRVHSFIYKESPVIFPPSSVNIDYEKNGDEHLIYSAFDAERKLEWLLPKINDVYFPELSFPHTVRQAEYEKMQNLKDNPFVSFQNQSYSIEQSLSPSLPQSDFTMRLRVMGEQLKLDLTEFEIENPGLALASSELYTYQIYVDASTGRLVGWQLITGEPSHENTLEELLKKIVPKLTFNSSKIDHSFLGTEVIELTLQPFKGSMRKIWCRCD